LIAPDQTLEVEMPFFALPYLPALGELLMELPALARTWAPVVKLARDVAITVAAMHHW
jgi:hypothetical protein